MNKVQNLTTSFLVALGTMGLGLSAPSAFAQASVTVEANVSTDDDQITTVVQDVDAEGPVAVDQISASFSDLACTPENARLLV